MKNKYPCPCCGYHTLSEEPGSYGICPVCYWEDDKFQRENPDYAGGANHISLNEGIANYRKFGACEARFLPLVREPLGEEMSDEKES